MNEIELKNIIKEGMKFPSDDFTDNLMDEITAIESVTKTDFSWKLILLILSCILIVVLSFFVKIPKFEFLDHTLGFSPVITPILCIIFLFIVFQQLYDLKNNIFKLEKNNVV